MTSSLVSEDVSKAGLLEARACSWTRVIKLRVVSIVFSSSSFFRTTGLVRKIPSGSTTVPKTVRPVGSLPDLSRRSVQSERLVLEMIFASCSMKIVCSGVSSSDASKSRIWSDSSSTRTALGLSCPRFAPAALVE